MLPDTCPAPLREAVRTVVHERDFAQWIDLDARDDPDPISLLRKRLQIELTVISARDLARSAAFGGFVVWVDGISPLAWGGWRTFLEEYAQASRSRPEYERAVFCVQAPTTGDPPQRDVTLDVAIWRDVVEPLDLFLLALQMRGANAAREPPLLSRLHAALVSELAAFDGLLAVELCDRSIDELLQPELILTRYAAARNWDRTTRLQGFRAGAEALVDGSLVPHVCVELLEGGDRRGIDRRIWRAQIAVLFPAFEEQRVRLLSRYGAFLRPPWRTVFGEIRDARDLELGHLLQQLRGRHGVKVEHLRLLECLAASRNALAHLECVGVDTVRVIAALSLSSWA